jgi:hypothetical protein
MMSARTYYFEIFTPLAHGAIEPCLDASFVQAKALTLHYWKYVAYSLVLCTKVVGVLQFDQRVTKNKVSCVFAACNLNVATLDVVCRPMILPHLRLWVLAKHHSAIFYEDGIYRMGAPTMWSSAIAPYVEKMQRVFDEDTQYQPVFDETIYPGLTKITSYIQALRRLPQDVI